VLSAVTASLLVCVVKLFIWYVAVCCLCVCVLRQLIWLRQLPLLVYWELIAGLHMRTGNITLVEYVLVLLVDLLG
jgi:hypothetical protein